MPQDPPLIISTKRRPSFLSGKRRGSSNCVYDFDNDDWCWGWWWFYAWGPEWMDVTLTCRDQQNIFNLNICKNWNDGKSKKKEKRWEDLTLEVFCNVRFANEVLFIEMLLWYSSEDTCLSHWPWFHWGLTFTFTPAIVEKVFIYRCIEKKQNNLLPSWTKLSTPQTVKVTLQSNSFFLIPRQQFHSRGYGAVKMWPVCSELLCVLLCIQYAFIKRTNWPCGLSVFICINSLL